MHLPRKKMKTEKLSSIAWSLFLLFLLAQISWRVQKKRCKNFICIFFYKNIFVCCGKWSLKMCWLCCMHCKMLSTGIYLFEFLLAFFLHLLAYVQTGKRLHSKYTRVRSLFTLSLSNSLYAMTLVSLLNVPRNRMCVCVCCRYFATLLVVRPSISHGCSFTHAEKTRKTFCNDFSTHLNVLTVSTTKPFSLG